VYETTRYTTSVQEANAQESPEGWPTVSSAPGAKRKERLLYAPLVHQLHAQSKGKVVLDVVLKAV